MLSETLPVRIAALYQFTRFADPASLKPALLAAGDAGDDAGGVKGTLLLAPEGINGTIAGDDAAVEAVLDHIRTLPGCEALEVKESRAAKPPFLRFKVRIKKEIVTMHQPDLDPVGNVGTYVNPHDWNALIADPDTIVIDTRNDYEVAIGTFDGAVDPQTATFGDFPEWFRKRRAELDAPKIAMFCTGGIRCEKATAFLKSEGVEEVYHLKGGILKYLENVPEEESRWQGECFVFDDRVAVKHALERGTHRLCRACRMPLSPVQRISEHYIEGVACEYCHTSRTDEQRTRYAERQRQEELAAKRGLDHLGAKLPEKPASPRDPMDDLLTDLFDD